MSESVPCAETPQGVKTETLRKIIRPVAASLYECDTPWHHIQRQLDYFRDEYGGVELNPDYQRGHVWTRRQQEEFIEAAMRGVLPSSAFLVQFNCPEWNRYGFKSKDLPQGFQCIDGLQRMTAIRLYMDGEITPFGMTVDEFDDSSFSARRSVNYRVRMAIYGFETKKQVLEHYLAHNTGGTPHSDEELNRVERMLMETGQ